MNVWLQGLAILVSALVGVGSVTLAFRMYSHIRGRDASSTLSEIRKEIRGVSDRVIVVETQLQVLVMGGLKRAAKKAHSPDDHLHLDDLLEAVERDELDDDGRSLLLERIEEAVTRVGDDDASRLSEVLFWLRPLVEGNRIRQRLLAMVHAENPLDKLAR